MNVILVVLLVLILLGVPQTGWHGYGYGPSGLLGTVLIVILILMLMGRL